MSHHEDKGHGQLNLQLIIALSDLFDDLYHLKPGLDDAVSLINYNSLEPPVLLSLAVVAHGNILVADRVHLVHSVLFADLVKASENLREQGHHLNRVQVVLPNFSDACQVGEDQSQIIEHVHLSLLVSDHRQDVEGHQSADENVRLLDFNIEDSLVVQ